MATFDEVNGLKEVEIAIGGVLSEHARARLRKPSSRARALTLDEIATLREKPAAPKPAPQKVSKYRKIAEEIADDLLKNEARAARFESIKEYDSSSRSVMPIPPVAIWTDPGGNWRDILRQDAKTLTQAEKRERQARFEVAQKMGYKVLK